ncbi:hypothetical protein [Staphylococcus agnetis]|uniref:XRE family transcriptional regulator n=1 Tax=Staphylococcus agnetis TaxID=985762 RepID=A0ABX3Z0T8_9STAP|nr:hypothetical protein [Staphylococcus agnetis]MDG4943960.1 hypothetical protein [Staphylococcus agnetis]OSP22615.1 hypothetical protein B9L42_00615 [Staphylococcus agnetis]OSP23094.1 hypothetical protein B9M87_09180 [Staphylococcus agnetis]OTW30491.1 hypothetical protein B9M88_09490 [Staphylococcus agnetis]
MKNEIIQTIKNLFEELKSSQISRETGLPYQTVQDLKNGRTHIEDAKFRTVIKLYEYQKSLKNSWEN